VDAMPATAKAPEREAQIAVVRTAALKDLEGMLQEAVDKVRAEGKASDYIAMLAQLSKISGVDQEKKDKYDGLKMVNILIGSNMSVSTTVESEPSIPISEPKNDQILDVEAKLMLDEDQDVDPDNPDGEHAATMAAFNMIGSSMVLPDD